MKKLLFICTILMISSQESTYAMWGKPESTAQTAKSMTETQRVNNTTTEEIANKADNLNNSAKQSADAAKQMKLKSQEQYNNSLSVKAVDAMTNVATDTWNWLTKKQQPAEAINKPGSVDLTSKPRSASNVEPVTTATTIDSKARSASDPGRVTSSNTSRSASPKSVTSVDNKIIDLKQNISTKSQEFINKTVTVDQKAIDDLSAKADIFKKKPSSPNSSSSNSLSSWGSSK